MATTSGNLSAGKSSAGRSDDSSSGRFHLRAKLALGAATLGCVAALAIGGLQPRDLARTPAPPVGRVATGTGLPADQVEWLAQLPLARTAAPGEDTGDQVAWLAGLQTAGPVVPDQHHAADQVAWLEQFQPAR
jgi:hypothetical protein